MEGKKNAAGEREGEREKGGEEAEIIGGESFLGRGSGTDSDNTRCGLYFSSYFFSLFLLPPLPSFPSFFSFFFIPAFFLIIFVISPS